MPVPAVLRRLHGGGGEASRRSSRSLAGYGQVVSLQAVRGPRVRSRPAHVDPLMERRVFIAILLSFAVLYGYQALFVPPQKPNVDVVEPKEKPAQPAPPATPKVVEQAPAEHEPTAQISDSVEREIVVETVTSVVVLTNRG